MTAEGRRAQKRAASLGIAMSTLAEVSWQFDDELGGTDPDFAWLEEHATFKHTAELVAEWIVHLGDGFTGDHWSESLKEMREAGCSPEFVQTCTAARDAGAVRIVFYV